MKMRTETKVTTTIDLDEFEVERIVADEIRAKHENLFPDSNMTVGVKFDISSGGVLRGATATIVRIDVTKEDK